MSVDFIAKYNNWDKTDPKELYTATIQKNEANPKLRMNDVNYPPRINQNQNFSTSPRRPKV